MTDTEVYHYLLKRTGCVRFAIDASTFSFGTGWILDLPNRLMVTNLHVVDIRAGKVEVWFPDRDKSGEVIHDAAHYFQNVKPIPATVIWTDRIRDLGLIQLDSLPDGLEEVPLAPASTVTGQQLFSLAGKPRGSEGLWIFSQGTVRGVYKRSIALGGPIQVVETQIPLNQGNSGGAIVNNKGELVAVFEGLRTDAQLVNMCIDLSEVNGFLKIARPLVGATTASDLNTRGDGHFAEKRFDLAMSDYTAAVQADPKYAPAVANRGWIFHEREDLATARAEFDAALKLDPEYADAYRGRAICLRSEGKYEQALDDLTQAIRRAPDEPQLYDDRGLVYYEQEKYDLALAEFDRAIARNDKVANFHSNRAETLSALGRHDEAFVAIDRATLIEPQIAEYFNIAGNIMYAKEEYEKAALLYDAAIKRNGKNAMFFRNRGDAFHQLKRLPEAGRDLAAAMEMDPRNADFANTAGIVAYDAGQYDAAVAAFTRAIAIDGANATYFRNRGDAHRFAERYGQAIADFSQAIKLDGQEAEYFVLRGRAHSAKSDSASAKKDFDRALALDPTTYTRFQTKFIVFDNQSGTEVNLTLQYMTTTRDDQLRWFPAEDRFITFKFKPGESAQLIDTDDFKIHASRLKFFAESTDGTKAWNDHKENELIVVPSEGYVNDSGTEEFRYTLNP